MLKEVKKCTYFEAQQVLRETYDTAYHVHDHVRQARLDPMLEVAKRKPLSLVGFHAAEEFGPTSRLYEKIELYFEREVGEHAKMSLEEFFSLPPEFTERILLICQKRQQKNTKQATELAAQLTQGAGMPKS